MYVCIYERSYLHIVCMVCIKITATQPKINNYSLQITRCENLSNLQILQNEAAKAVFYETFKNRAGVLYKDTTHMKTHVKTRHGYDFSLHFSHKFFMKFLNIYIYIYIYIYMYIYIYT